MKPQGRGTNSLLRAVHDQQAFGRRPLARRDSLIERARSESQSWTSRKTRGVRPRGEVFFLTSPFIGHVTQPLCILLISNVLLVLARHNIRKPVRCQRTTVSGVTMMRDSFQADQTRRAMTQKSLSKRPRLGRGCRRFSTASCCRSVRFSKTRFPRLRKRRISAPSQRRSRLNMAGSYTRSTIGSIVVSS